MLCYRFLWYIYIYIAIHKQQILESLTRSFYPTHLCVMATTTSRCGGGWKVWPPPPYRARQRHGIRDLEQACVYRSDGPPTPSQDLKCYFWTKSTSLPTSHRTPNNNNNNKVHPSRKNHVCSNEVHSMIHPKTVWVLISPSDHNTYGTHTNSVQ